VAALASLATGVSPATHRLTEPGLGFLPALPRLRPLGHELRRRGVPTTIICAELGAAARSVAWTLAAAAGASRLVVPGSTAGEVAHAAAQELGAPALTVAYLPDCDRAGHAEGWMSPAYRAAATEVDGAIHTLAEHRRDALLVVLADHGGGGIRAREHDEPHPLNELIPLVLAGPDVHRGQVLAGEASLLDVPPTILWSFGAPVPESYEGRVLEEAFVPAPAPVVAA
jgi:hypothetical protein